MAVPAPSAPLLEVAHPQVGTARRRSRRQAEAATVITPDAPCTPVLVRAAIVGPARMPRVSLEITRPGGEVIGHVSLPNTSAAFDPTLRWWLVGQPAHGSLVALVSEGHRQVLLPGSRLRLGPVVEQDWSPLACRLLGWQRRVPDPNAPAGFQAVYSDSFAAVDNPGFVAAVRRFRTAAVTVPMIFFAICFPYLFVIPPLIAAGTPTLALLALPVVGGGMMTAWSAHCRREVAAEADRIEAGAARWGREIAFTQSYWASMRKPSLPWDGPLPAAAI